MIVATDPFIKPPQAYEVPYQNAITTAGKLFEFCRFWVQKYKTLFDVCLARPAFGSVSGPPQSWKY